MSKIIINESSIYFKEYGSGEPLLLIAGLASDSQSWLTVIVSLSKHFRVIIFDNRGVGRSPKNNSEITIHKMTDDCVSLINHLNISKINVLGHSMGGMIAMDLALRYPNLINKLILEATAPKLNKRNIDLFNDWCTYLDTGMEKSLWFKNIFYWIFSPTFFENNIMVKQAIEMSVNYSYLQSDNSFKNQIIAISNFNCLDDIKNIKLKTLVIFGEMDLLFPIAQNIELFASVSNLQEVTVPNAAHSIHVDNPIFFSNTVISFLNK